MERIAELLHTEPEVRDRPDALPAVQPARGAIRFEQVHFRYPSRPEQIALDDFSLDIRPGETIALVGPSGAGKSTLFQLLLRFHEAESGRILVDDQSIDATRLADLRSGIAVVPQHPVIFAMDAASNIAMGRDGMLYSLPSRDIIADSVEYMVNAHCADALVCISNCDKITPGMLMAALRLNIPVVFVSGGPMEAGKTKLSEHKLDLVDAMVIAVDDAAADETVAEYERSACPTCGSCSGMFTANSMNCLTEALGLALPGNGSLLATHADREKLFVKAGRLIVDLAKRYYEKSDASVLPRAIAGFKAFENAIALDISMGGSTNTVLHLLAAAQEAGVNFTMADIDRMSRRVPCLAKVAPATQKYHMEDVHRAGGIMAILGELDRAGLIHRDCPTVLYPTLGEALDCCDVKRNADPKVHEYYRAAPGGVPTQTAFSQSRRYPKLDLDRANGCIRDKAHAYSQDGGLAVLFGNIAEKGCIVKTAGVDDSILKFTGRARVCESQEEAVEKILADKIKAGDVVIVRYEGPKGGAGRRERLSPTSAVMGKGLGNEVALITDGRFSGGSHGFVVGHITPEAQAGGPIAIVKNGDPITIDADRRTLTPVSYTHLTLPTIYSV